MHSGDELQTETDGRLTLVEPSSHVEVPRVDLRNRKTVVEPRSDVAGELHRLKLLVRGLTGQSELRGETDGRRSEDTEKKRSEGTRPGTSSLGSMRHGVTKWVVRKQGGSLTGGRCSEKRALVSEVSDIQGMMSFRESKVAGNHGTKSFGESEGHLDKCHAKNRSEDNLIGMQTGDNKRFFVDPLDVEAGLRDVAGPILSMEGNGFELDPVFVGEMGPYKADFGL